MKRLRILMVAYACEPGKGSEPGVGWNWALQAARLGHEVHVITRENNRQAIETEISYLDDVRLFFHYVDFPHLICRLKKQLGYFVLPIYYYSWQFLVWRRAQKLVFQQRFDFVHHVTFVIDWMPSGLCLLRLPFIWGPVGGSTHFIPKIIKAQLPIKARFQEFIRRLIQNGIRYCDPMLALTRNRAQLILVYTQEALSGIPLKHRHKTQVIAHIGVNKYEGVQQFRRPSLFPPDSEFKVLTNGRLVPWKGYELLIRGFARFLELTQSYSHLIITGEGPFLSYLQHIITQCGYSDKIRLVGYLPSRDDVYATLQECDLYALLTSRDGPPVAILEAMYSGCPIFCIDNDVTKELIPKEAKITIPIVQSNYPQLIETIALQLKWAHSNKVKLPQMGQIAKRYIEGNYTWGHIGERLADIYGQLHRPAPQSQ